MKTAAIRGASGPVLSLGVAFVLGLAAGCETPAKITLVPEAGAAGGAGGMRGGGSGGSGELTTPDAPGGESGGGGSEADGSRSNRAEEVDAGPGTGDTAKDTSESDAPVPPPGGNWVRTTLSGPPARYYVQLAYAGGGKFITFGGNCADSGRACDEGATWEYDGATGAWTRSDTGAMPVFRSSYALAYDSARNRVVLFGGSSPGGPALRDTWEWNGLTRAWANVTPAGGTGPSARNSPRLSYDANRGRTVLFGGYVSGAAAPEPNNETWEWDGSAWARMAPATVPSSAITHGMAYLPPRKAVVLVADNPARTGIALWSWDGTTWTAMPSEGELSRAPGRRNYGVAYAGGDHLVLFGGYRDLANRGASDDETWQWDGRTWTRVAVSGPPPGRELLGLAFDEKRSRVVLFGGAQWQVSPPRYLALGDTWEFYR